MKTKRNDIDNCTSSSEYYGIIETLEKKHFSGTICSSTTVVFAAPPFSIQISTTDKWHVTDHAPRPNMIYYSIMIAHALSPSQVQHRKTGRGDNNKRLLVPLHRPESLELIGRPCGE